MDIDAQAARDSTASDPWCMGVRRLAVASGPNIFQMLLVCLSSALDRLSNQRFFGLCCIFNRSVVKQLRRQFFIDFHQILHAARKFGRFVLTPVVCGTNRK